MYFTKNAFIHLLELTSVISSMNMVSGAGSGNGVGARSSNGNTPGGNNGNGPGANNGKGAVTTIQPAACVVHTIESLNVNATDDDDDEDVTVCVMEASYEGDGVGGIAYELNETSFEYGFFKDVEPSQTKLTISAAAIKRQNGKHGGGILSVEPGADIKKEKKNPNAGQQGKGQGQGLGKNRGLRGNGSSMSVHRGLAQATGDSTLIVLNVMPPDAINDKRTSVQLANDIFGINTTEVQDTINARTQMQRCSRGQLNYLPACGTQDQECFGEPLIVNGILDVPIVQNVTGVASGNVKNFAIAEAQVILNGTGIDLLNNFTQIMVVIPDEASWGGAAAWAYKPGQVSAFRDSYSYRMGIQMHEFDNINLGHSGYDGAAYKDHSCLMGSPSYGDDGPEICWNGAKSFQLGWYASDSLTVDPSAGVFSADLIGVADWVDEVYTPGQHKVVLEIHDSSEVESFYIIYNRAKGPNKGVTFAKDEVTITKALSGKTSWHQGSLGMPDPTLNEFPVFRKPNYNGGTKDLVVKVCDMTAGTQGVTPDTASILIYLDDGPGYNNGPMCPGEVSCIADSECDDGNWCTQNSCDLATNQCNPPVDISATQCPSCGDLTYCNPAGYCDLVCNDKKTCTSDSCVLGQCNHDPIPGCAPHGGLLETWFNIGGSQVLDLTESYTYQNNDPDETEIIQGSLKTVPGRGSSYGARLRTYIFPTTSGGYTFYVASDDHSELWLSTDDNPANKVRIAWLNTWSSPEQFDLRSSQKSVSINLLAGNAYYLEALHKEGGGGDHLSVAWESIDAAVPLTVIGGSNFFVEPPVACTVDSHCSELVTNPCNAGYCNVGSGFCEYIPISGCENGAKLELWTGITGTYLDDLTSDPRFPDSPDQTSILSNALEAPSNAADNFGSRMQTYLLPPFTCDYTFYIATDDQGQLNLSSNTDPANKVTIAYVDGYTKEREWNKYPSQTSAPIHLEKGQLVYMEALHKDGGSNDNLAIGWECLQHGMTLEVIDSSYTVVTPIDATPRPSSNPTKAPSDIPTTTPSKAPTNFPTQTPTRNPTVTPTIQPTTSPSTQPTKAPTNSPSTTPSKAPSVSPTTAAPTMPPTDQPTEAPTSSPTRYPTITPTTSPTDAPTTSPSKAPTDAPVSGMLRIAGDNGSPAEAFPLGECEGDCDWDSQCEGDLKCYQRKGIQAVPGCWGSGVSNKDYCAMRLTETTLFLTTNNGFMGNCDGNCNLDADCEGTLICEYPDADGAVEGCDGIGHSDAKYCRIPSLFDAATDGAPAEAFPLGLCEGGCVSDSDCEGELECFQRIGTEAVLGCQGLGTSGAGYCTVHSPNDLWIEAENGSPLDAFPLGVCEGNCQTDSDCEGNLICEVRVGDEDVPGCNGPGRSGNNYCRHPSLVKIGNNPDVLLWQCEGDCDLDEDCAGSLLCFHRSGNQDVVGCAPTGTSGTDYCVERPTNTTLFLMGNNGSPAINYPLGICEGDCDNDGECEEGLVCFQRSRTEAVPGCDGVGAYNQDYCHDPNAGIESIE